MRYIIPCVYNLHDTHIIETLLGNSNNAYNSDGLRSTQNTITLGVAGHIFPWHLTGFVRQMSNALCAWNCILFDVLWLIPHASSVISMPSARLMSNPCSLMPHSHRHVTRTAINTRAPFDHCPGSAPHLSRPPRAPAVARMLITIAAARNIGRSVSFLAGHRSPRTSTRAVPSALLPASLSAAQLNMPSSSSVAAQMRHSRVRMSVITWLPRIHRYCSRRAVTWRFSAQEVCVCGGGGLSNERRKMFWT